jgi:hypothetical protein
MNRRDFESRMLRDPELRQKMEDLEELAHKVRDLEVQLQMGRMMMQSEILSLGKEGVPLAALARLVGLTPQRINAIVQQAKSRLEKGLQDQKELKEGARQ